jgi:hypothetical protein
MRKTFCILAGLLFLALNSFAQSDFSNFIRYQDDIEDSEKLMTAFVSPFMKTATLGLTGGWYNTAKTHKMFGFDVTTSLSFVTIPDKDLFFNVDALGLKNFELASAAKGDDVTSPDYPNAPTVLGPDNTPQFVYTGNGEREVFSGPPGINIKDELKMQKLPIPMVNVGFSLPKGTDLKIRFAPTIKVGKDGEFKFWGVGVMHDVKQYIPGLKMVPFDLSAFVGHTQMEFVYKESSGDIHGKDQHGVMKMAATTIQGVISKKISVITFYGGFGYNIANSKLQIKGTYEVNDDEQGTVILTDPIKMDFGSSSARLTGGVRLKLAVFTLHGDYSFQKYHSINAGLGISVN